MRAVIIAILLFAAGCSGGGGGSGESGSDARTGVRLLHGALEGGPAVLLSDAQPAVVIARAFFAEPSLHVPLAQAPQVVQVARAANHAQSFGSFSIDVAKNQRRTILLYGDQANLGLTASQFTNGEVQLTAEQSGIRVIHAAVGAGQLDVSAGGAASQAAFGAASEYLVIPAGSVIAEVRRHADRQILARPELMLEGGAAYSLFVTGEVGYLIVTRLLRD